MSIIPFPDKKYNIIYADPPWQYNESWGNGQVGYDTMTNDDIIKLFTEYNLIRPWANKVERNQTSGQILTLFFMFLYVYRLN